MTDPIVYVCFPSAMKSHVPVTIGKWAERGYLIAMLTDSDTSPGAKQACDLWLHTVKYPGVWKAWNMLAKAAVANGADVCVLIGDDMRPEPRRTAQEIATEYLQRWPDGNGVMQPTGDKQGERINGKWASQRICGSPWVGRKWVATAYDGHGPVNGAYGAFYADEELQIIAEARGLLWQREDLAQDHLHWSFQRLPRQEYHERNDRNHWAKDKALFESRKKGLFQQ